MLMLSSVDNLHLGLKSQSAQSVFFALFNGQARESALDSASCYLSSQLMNAAPLDSDLPEKMEDLYSWMDSNVERVGQSYRQYLEERKAGAARRFFSSKAHALYFLKSVAPTKMVDGAWLYGLLGRWQDARFTALIKTYLEELGEGLPTKNHVVLYKKLLANHGLERWDDLSDEHYVQGAIQLALAYHAERFLPEVIGFNLGYEQLPLHLLITAYELKELGIDPYYFTLHITVDNADSGHAKKAVDAIFDAIPKLGDSEDFYRRVRNGYNLNFLGANTNSVIESFDLEQEMTAIFSKKGKIGQYAHSDYRQVAGRSINDWLSDSTQTTSLIHAMEQGGWFKRHQDPQNSRFWKLIQGEKAKMFGVFSPYEQQVIYDWIAGDALQNGTLSAKSPELSRPHLSFEEKRRLFESVDPKALTQETGNNDFEEEKHMLEESLTSAADQRSLMARLIASMSPAHHHTASGLTATRIFNEVLG